MNGEKKRLMKTMRILGVAALCAASPLAAQDPTPPTPPVPAQPAPAPMPAPASTPVVAPSWAPVASTPFQRRGWFGIQLSCEDCFIQRAPGRVAYTQRPAISWVDGNGPAYNAGLRSGDTLASVNGASITTPEGFEQFVNATPGTAIRFGVRRNGQEREVTVTPGANSSMTTAADYYNQRLRTAQRNGLQALRNAFRSPIGWLGLGIQCEQCSVSTLTRRQSWRFNEPPAIVTVDVDGPAHRALLRRGDTLTAIDGIDLTSPEGGRAFAQVEPGQRVTLTYKRAGVERRANLVAVARPDASREEIAAFDEYKRYRDSSVAIYRDMMTTNVARLRAETTDLERMLRELDANRGAMDSSQRRLATLDSLVRAMRTVERARLSNSGDAYTYIMPPNAPMAMTMTVPLPAVVSGQVATTIRGGLLPLRYSGRLKDLANIEVRSLAPANVNEVGDSLIVVTVSGVEVKVALRAAAVRR